MYKLVALDLDGTLLNDKQEIPAQNVKVIKQLKDMGVHFVIVTGRSDNMTKNIVAELGISAPILGNNGASIRDASTGELLHLSDLSLDLVKKMYLYFIENHSYARWYGLDEVFSFNEFEFDEEKNPYAKFSKRLAQNMDFHIFRDFEELEKYNPEILRCMYVNEDPVVLNNTWKELRELVDAEIFKSSDISLDVVAKNTSKGNALLAYGETMGISPNEMIAIGDSGNDISMLNVVGMPVTLENGDDMVKSIAKLVTASNNDAGVAKALIKIFDL